MNAKPSTLAYTEASTASALAYQALKSWILEGGIPLGLRLREERLGERLGVSRTPVREALLRLHAERFLERHPEAGFRVAAPSAQTMGELYELRRALELFAVRRGSEREGGHDGALLEQLEEEWSGLAEDASPRDADFVLLDEEFHARLAEAAGNARLAEELRRVNERIRPVRSHDFLTPGRIGTTIEQHLELLEAIRGRDAELACLLLDRHIQESQRVVEAAVAGALERMLSPGVAAAW